MAYIVVVLIPLVLIAGLFPLTSYEDRRGVRFFAKQRTLLDGKIDHAIFIFENVDLNAFIQDLVHRIVHQIAHDIAHLSLLSVRAVERGLTRIVRHLRANRVNDMPQRESTREFVKTLSDFKEQLRETPPEIPDIY